MNDNKIIFSGIQPSGNLHIGNYLGAVKHWVNGQNDKDTNIFCVVDLHAITVPQDPEKLREGTLELAGLLLASGIDPEKSFLFVQSHNIHHAQAAWVLNCFTSMGQLGRMTQYKDKSEKNEFVSVGLFDYPVLMAADILLYGTTHVPVGEDQKQHVELARDLAQRFNHQFGDTFVVPEPVIPKIAGRVMSLTEPQNKMSKSDPAPASRIELLDDMDTIRKKIAKATTDSDGVVAYNPETKPAVSNLIEIYSMCSDMPVSEIEKKFEGKNYGEFKSELAEIIVGVVDPIQKRYKDLRSSGKLEQILYIAADNAMYMTGPKLQEMYEKVGFIA